ncbi:MAG TPA: nucleotide sugar dehydrogenase [Candidatus Cybelea sp.]|nr:nucleotide sugar dehydrogenase [Candidatus Cybelea sp.]
MRISIFGLGYVGTVTAACLARLGHHVIGVDPNSTKVSLIAGGAAPVVERDVGPLIADAVRHGRLTATGDGAAAVRDSELSIVCVGTPSQANGSLDLSYLKRVCEEIGAALAAKSAFHVVAIRSTMLPGTMREVVFAALETRSGKRAGVGFGVCNNPEFLREGTAVADFEHPPKTVIGETDARSGDVLAGIYGHLKAPLVRCPIEVAEMVKYADNAWHALKIAFANEIGNVCKPLGIDSHAVMDIFCQDRKLNISPNYLRPGFAFGGSCLPKDLRALTYKARTLDVDVPVLSAILPSNQHQIERGLRMILARGRRKIGVLGFSFKAGTDDLRESPVVELIERLIGKGFDIRLFDRNVNLARLTGANRDYILRVIPHISGLMVDSIDRVLAHAEIVVIGNSDPEFNDVPASLRPGQSLIDLVRVKQRPADAGAYEGICW